MHGLLALMELQASRMAARTDAEGRPILLADQDRTRWDPLLIRRGLAALERAEALGGANGSYALQAAIAACHARAPAAGSFCSITSRRNHPSSLQWRKRSLRSARESGSGRIFPSTRSLTAGPLSRNAISA